MRKNWVREKLRAGESTVGALLGLGSPNAAELMGQPDIDGALVGGASLDAKSFLDIACFES